jgi:hypothetical protein
MRVEVMRMKRKTQQTQWPRTLYLTPDRWSPHAEVYVVDERELRRMVIELRKLGGEWRKVSMLDATTIEFVREEGNDTALYGYGYHPTLGGGKLYRVRRRRDPNGVLYEWEEV